VKKPLCSAAATAVLIDVDKGVRPCCAYEGDHAPNRSSVGNLREQSLAEILGGDEWSKVREKLAASEVPKGCAACVTRERHTGHSQRVVIENFRSPNWHKGVTFLELNSSNLCNLRCRHCNSVFSSRWSKHQERHGRKHMPVVLPDSELLLENLRGIDVSLVDRINLKGGEPMINSDVMVLLRHLDDEGVLGNVVIHTVTNGSLVNEEFLEFAARARELRVRISVDGVGEVQQYIRDGGASIKKIEAAVARYTQLPNAWLARSTSVMAYNVSTLDEMDLWWDGLADRYPGNYVDHIYDWFVIDPRHLSLHCLQDETRQEIASRYEKLPTKRYEKVLKMLAMPFAGVSMHNEFVRQTKRIDGEFGRKWQDSIPELAHEMVVLPEPENV
jgi:hypothetical protein